MRNQSVVLVAEEARSGTRPDPWTARPEPRIRVAARAEPPPLDRGTVRAAYCLEPPVAPIRLSTLWEALRAGRATPCDAWHDATRSYVVVHTVGDAVRTALYSSEAVVITRVLCGHQQKAIASDLGLAHSTISKLRASALAKLHLAAEPMPLPYVLAVQAAATGVEIPTATQGAFEHHGSSYLAVSVPLPRVRKGCGLSPSEQEVALYLIEGCSRTEIARRRSTSPQTVLTQLAATYAKLGLSGRNGAIARAAALGWFSWLDDASDLGARNDQSTRSHASNPLQRPDR